MKRAPPTAAGRTAVVGLWLLVLLLAGLVVGERLRVEDDLAAFLPAKTDPFERRMMRLATEGPASRLVLAAIEGGTPEERAGASRRARAALEGLRGVVRVENGEGADPAAFDALRPYRYLLADAGPLDAAGLRAALEDRLGELRSPLALLAQEGLADDPTAALRGLLLKGAEGVPRRVEGVLASKDGARALLLIETAGKGFAFTRKAATVAAIEEALDEAAAPAGLEVVLTGPPVFAVTSAERIDAAVTRLSAIAAALVAALVLWTFRSLGPLLLASLPLLTAYLVGVAAVLLAYGAIHGIALAFAMTLLGVTVDYPIHLLAHQKPGDGLGDAARAIRRPLWLGALTTALAFGVIGFSGLPGLGQLALCLGAGLLAAALVADRVLPALRPGQPPARLAPLLPLPLRAPRPLAPLLLGLGLLAALHLLWTGGAVWADDLAALNPVPVEEQRQDERLRADLGAPDLGPALAVSAPTAEAVLLAEEAIEPRLRDLVASGGIGGFDMASLHLPSVARQKARQAGLPDAPALRKDLDGAVRGLPFKAGLFAPFLAAVAASRTKPPLTAEAGLRLFGGTPLGPRLEALLGSEGGLWHGLVTLSGVRDRAAPGAVAQGSPAVRAVDLAGLAGATMTEARDAALRHLAAGSVLILAVPLLVRRRALDVPAAALALGLALVLTASLLVLLGERLNLFHVLACLLVVGAGLDYALFFLHAGDGDAAEGGLRWRTLHAVVLCAASTGLVFDLIATAGVPVLRAIGLTVGLGTALAFLCAYALLARGGDLPRGET